MAKYSVIVPVYNVGPYLSECLDSLEAQTFGDWEAICVDDGSTDESGGILDRYAARDARFKAVHQANAGVSVARNRAMELVSGEWLTFLDADDLLVPDALERMDALVERGGHDAIFLGEPVYFRKVAPARSSGSGATIMEIAEADSGKRLLMTGRLWGWPAIRLLRASLFKGVGFPVGVANLEDSISLLDVLAVKSRWLWVDLRTYCYRSRDGSASRDITAAKATSIVESFAKMHDAAVEKLGLTQREARVLMKQYSSHMGIYIAAALPGASVEDVKSIASAYRETTRRIGYDMADVFIRTIMDNATHFGSKAGCGILLKMHRLYIRALNGAKRRLDAISK